MKLVNTLIIRDSLLIHKINRKLKFKIMSIKIFYKNKNKNSVIFVYLAQSIVLVEKNIK